MHRNLTYFTPCIHKQKNSLQLPQFLTFKRNQRKQQFIFSTLFQSEFIALQAYCHKSAFIAAVWIMSSISILKKSNSTSIDQWQIATNFQSWLLSECSLSEMATARTSRLSVNSAEAQRAVINSLWKSGKRGTDIHRHLFNSFGQDNALPLRTIQWWCKEFREGRVTLDRDPAQDRPIEPSTLSLQGRIQGVLDEDARVTVRELEDVTGASRNTIFRTLKSMGMSKLSARWVPCILTSELKQGRMQACQRNRQLVDDCGRVEAMLSRLVTSDESWISHFDPKTKKQSKSWMRKRSDPPVKAARSVWKKKIMLTAFFDKSGVLTLDFLEEGATVNSERYCHSLKKMKDIAISDEGRARRTSFSSMTMRRLMCPRRRKKHSSHLESSRSNTRHIRLISALAVFSFSDVWRGSFMAALLICAMLLKKRSNAFVTESSNEMSTHGRWRISWSVGRNASQ